MIRVTLTTSYAGPGIVRYAGETVLLPDEEAERLVARGHAVLCQPSIESTATAPDEKKQLTSVKRKAINPSKSA
ncbi:MAG: hypothetical protein RMJ19_05615 [Gemmatales bacterium]|nr:hypothetical protein [Gemmatales bacterium]MDW8175131.1 hypothetical protein [Gemmatales bacterium]